MIEVLRAYEKRYPSIRAVPSLPRREYLGLLRVASVLVGNSSSGIIDAPSFGLPAVNIGTRQEGRERGNNIIGVGHDRKEIVAGIRKALTDRKFRAAAKKCVNPYGDGKAGLRIAEVLGSLKITPRLLQKKIAY